MKRMRFPTRKDRIPAILTIVLVILAGCGRPDTPTGVAAYPAPQLTPTLSPLDSTKQADDARFEAERATARAGPTPATLVFPPTAPVLTPQTGIDSICDSIYADHYAFLNCWRGAYAGQWLTVFAGTKTKGDTQGLLTLYLYDETTYITSEYFKYPAPSAAGSIRITEVTLPRFTLVSTGGTTYIFNVDTRMWETVPYPSP
jgi:hypothetical protein